MEIREYSDLLVIESNRYRDKTWTERLAEKKALDNIWKAKAEENLHKSPGRGKKGCQNLDKVSWTAKEKAEASRKISENAEWRKRIDSKKEVAKSFGISHETIRKAEVIAKEKPELLQAIDAGKKSIDGAYLQIKREKNLQEFHAKEQPLPERGKYETGNSRIASTALIGLEIVCDTLIAHAPK